MKNGRVFRSCQVINKFGFSFGLLYKEGSLVNMERVRRGLAADPSCPICGFHLEDALNILRDCTVASDVWNQVVPEGSSWACLFGLLIWSLWKNHNLSIFQGRSWNSMEMVQVSSSWANQLFSASRAKSKASFKTPAEKESFEGPIFLNTDGAVQLGSRNTAAREVVRDANGNWIFGYNLYLGKCFIFNAELWGILERLRLIQRRDHDEIIIQFDSMEVVKAILDSSSTEANSTLIRRIQSILFQEKQWFLQYIPRDQNQVTNCLVKQALIRTDNWQVFNAPFPMMRSFMELDKNLNVCLFQNTTM
ncbi:hypothetical protein PVK06_024017 [Gossypium arboreum]|uniref:RNase H type-1 domain-containing protein n=1 Tax=Gossypium arboreum TaxID=29729 RepID=A0ABR0PCS3_GOSAR|nr:hypothetical protein PVK06_024017 [Gossypium arboreum]